jgi:CheY-like chemotaxis protein
LFIRLFALRDGRLLTIVQDLVLIVDDDRAIRDVLSALLKYDGFAVIVATTGEDAIALIEQRPDLAAILLDLTMPGMGGMEALRKIRVLRPQLPVLLMSGYTVETPSPVLAVDGITAFMPKPFDLSVLRHKMRTLLSARNAQTTAATA